MNSQWGTVSVQGRLGQVHRAILDAILQFGTQTLLKDDSVALSVHPYHILRVIGHRNLGSTNRRWLTERFDDLQRAEISIHTSRIASTFRIIERHGELRSSDSQYGVKLTREYVRFLQKDDAWMTYTSSDIQQLNKLPGIVQATVRFMRSHSPGKSRIGIDKVLAAIDAHAADPSHRRYRRARGEIHKHAEDILHLGIYMDDRFILSLDNSKR